MQILKNISKNYLLPIILAPIVSGVFLILVKFIFASGNYMGVFIRGLYELVIKNV